MVSAPIKVSLKGQRRFMAFLTAYGLEAVASHHPRLAIAARGFIHFDVFGYYAKLFEKNRSKSSGILWTFGEYYDI
jgi:hypothetical protein